MRQNPFKSYNIGPLPDGCKQCVAGLKSVIFITGHCPRKCFYCPVSEHKMYKDVIYCNEKLIDAKTPQKQIQQIIQEVKISKSKGAGITGGDPLCALDRTCKVIRRLKKEFGKSFHIHIYTSLNLLDKKAIAALKSAGLDEFRVHPDLYDQTLWPRIALAKNQFHRYGIEVPAIPEREGALKQLMQYALPFVDYINLNELEASCTNAGEFVKRGLNVKQLSSYAVVGSSETALRLIKIKSKIPVHFCTCKLKDAVQLANRLKRRAKSIVTPYQFVTQEGTLYFGEIVCDSSNAAQKYACKLASEFKIPDRLISLRGSVIRIAAWVLLDLKDDIPYKKLLVTQYPTADEMRVMEEEI